MKQSSYENYIEKIVREELASVAQWTTGSPYQQKSMDASLRLLVVRKALRAAHLDPTNEKAAYLVALHVDALYTAGGRKKTLACYSWRLLRVCVACLSATCRSPMWR